MKEKLKYCKGCEKEIPINNFYKSKDKNGKYYYSSCYCKKCTINRHQEYLKQYKIQHQDDLKKYNSQYYQERRQQKIEYQKQYYQEHKQEKAKYDKTFREKYKPIKNKRELERLHNDNLYHLKQQLRRCIYASFKKKGFYKKNYTQEIVGCDYDFFINYILQTYKDNYGIEWDGNEPIHIDHKTPLATATTEKDIIKLCHYSNLQLLKAHDNLIKGAKLNYNRGD